MTKKKSVLSLILALCLCLALAVPALAADLQQQDVINLKASDFSITSCEKVGSDGELQKLDVKLTNSEKSIEVYSAFDDISTNEIEKYLLQANVAIAQEKNAQRNIDEEEACNVAYNYVDDDKLVYYTNINDEEQLYIVEPMTTDDIERLGLDFPKVDIQDSSIEPLASANHFQDGGIGIRGYGPKAGSYISATVNNPYVANYNNRYTVYYYVGLKSLNSETPNADMGVQYSSVNGGSWKPYYLLKQNNKTYMISGGDDIIKVLYKNDMVKGDNNVVIFATNKPMSITLYKNIAASLSSVPGNIVRLSIRGGDGYNSGKSCLYIAEGGTGITQNVQYRVLATINRADKTTVPNDTIIGMSCDYTNVNVDGQAVTWQGTPEAYMAVITNKSAGVLKGSVNIK